MKKMAFKIMDLIKFTILFLCVHLSVAQLFNFRENIGNTLQECTDDNFIRGITECFVRKFEDLIPAPYSESFDYSEASYNTGRHPLSMAESNVRDASIRQNFVIPQISKHLSASHRKLLDIIWTAGHAALEVEHQYMALEKLKHINLQEIIYTYIVDIMEHTISPYLIKLNHDEILNYIEGIDMESDTQNTIEECNEQVICRDPSNIPCILCKILAIVEVIDAPVRCLAEFSETDFEDGVRWLKCFYTCEDLIPISGCLKTHFAQCGSWSVVGDVIVKGFVEFTELSYCKLKVVSERNLTLVEGGASEVVTFYNYLPPTAHCLDFQTLNAPLGMIRALGTLLGVVMGDSPDCEVHVEMSLQNYWHNILPHIDNPFGTVITAGRPKCHNRMALRQAVVGYHDYNNNTAETCIVRITEENWNQTFNVPIWASVDLKNDGNVTTDFTLKLVTGRQIQHNEKIKVEVVDADIENSTLCMSAGDPHITTFDGHYYNNMYEGYFYLYKNTFLPYEVQVIYQKCTPNANATCTCAVAVKSGDDVFVVDKCRRVGQNNADTILRAVMFVNGEVTPGTRVFSKADGGEMQVLLPTGLLVDIVTANEALSVYVNPSNYDFELTEGLCGYFDGDASNDLMFANGTIYQGDGSASRGQPRPFNQAWRVPEAERLFEGSLVEEEPEDIGRYCKCNHRVFRGVECTCGPGEIVETCDMDLSGEVTSVIGALTKKSRKSSDVDSNIGMSDIDLDESFNPPEIAWGADATWDDASAEAVCNSILGTNSSNAIVTSCVASNSATFMQEAYWQCLEDIQITNSDNWLYSAIETGKRKCITYYLRGIDLGYTYEQYLADACLNDCTGRGTCNNGTCACESGWMGGDCSIANAEPLVVMDDSSLCDTRTEDCNYATLYGKHFRNDGSLSCRLRNAEMKSNGDFETKGDSYDTDELVFVSTYQVACKLPSARSYEISLEYNGQPVAVSMKTAQGSPDLYSDNFIFMVYDSACYQCSLAEQSCDLRGPVNGVEEYCMISDSCYAVGQHKPDDDCRYCNSTERQDEWTWYTDEVCEVEKEEYVTEQDRAQRERTIRISLAVILTVLIIVLTIVLYVVKNKKKQVDIDHKVGVTPADGDVNYYKSNGENGGFEMDGVNGHYAMVSPQVQKLKEMENAAGGGVGGGSNSEHGSRLASVSSVGSASDLDTARAAARAGAREKRRHQSRTHSTSSVHSVRSVGIGAAGPVQYAAYNQHLDSTVIGMGGHASPALPTKNDIHKGIHINAAY